MENYQQIKIDLDDFRLLVEQSELWVYKKKSGGKKEKKKNENDKEGGDGTENSVSIFSFLPVLIYAAKKLTSP